MITISLSTKGFFILFISSLRHLADNWNFLVARMDSPSRNTLDRSSPLGSFIWLVISSQCGMLVTGRYGDFTNSFQMCLPIYNNDVYAEHYGASVMAATTFMRFAISSAFPLFTAQMISNLGFDWAISLLGFVSIAMIPVPWVFFKWGPILRSKSRYLRDW